MYIYIYFHSDRNPRHWFSILGLKWLQAARLTLCERELVFLFQPSRGVSGVFCVIALFLFNFRHSHSLPFQRV